MQSEDDVHQGGLSRSGGPDEADHAFLGDLEVKSVDDVPFSLRVAEADVLQNDAVPEG
jgi:hypothetical protein